ncbi:MAG: site-specific integrase [Clostridia bacterium]|nr:site-specific integrase [Clostridia bacterium]
MEMARIGNNIYKRTDGRYEGRYVIGRKPDGKTRFGYVYGYQYQTVYNKLLIKKAETITGVVQRKKKTELLNTWFSNWMNMEVCPRVKISTYQTYEYLCKKHLYPLMDGVYLDSVTSNMVNSFIQKLINEGLAINTIKGIYRLFSAGIRAAYDEGYMPVNPCRKIKIRNKRLEERVLTKDEQKRIIKKAADNQCMEVIMALYTGMRLGEVCALQWDDINWNQGTIRIRRTVQRIKARTDTSNRKTMLYVDSPKSEQSNRTLPVPSFILELLRKNKNTCDVNNYIFGKGQTPAEPRTIQRKAKKLLLENGIHNAHFHTFRHSFATRLIEIGIDIKTVSALLGHSSSALTLDIYSHCLIEHKQDAISKLITYA